MKWLRNRNVLILGAMLLAVAVIAAVGLTLRPAREISGGTLDGVQAAETAEPDAQGDAQPANAQDDAQAANAPSGTQAAQTEAPAKAQDAAPLYLLVTIGGTTYEPIALTEEGSYTVKQGDKSNTIHVTRDSICMEASTCENQDCVEQGTVTLENRDSRVLGNMIICLPNQVQLELYTQEELVALVMNSLE